MNPLFKTLQRLLDAMAFANAGNDHDVQQLLNCQRRRPVEEEAPERPRARMYRLPAKGGMGRALSHTTSWNQGPPRQHTGAKK